jgi:CheY-like chemotaxis protein
VERSDVRFLEAESPQPESAPSPVVGRVEADLAGALHEVSNALTVVLGWLDVAHAKLSPGEEKDAVEVARTHARLGHRVAREAIGAEVFPGGTSERAAKSLAQCALVGVAPQAERRGIKTTLVVGSQASALIPHVGAALQILTNLLLNAIDFSPEGSVVTLDIQEELGDAIFSVTDSGPGIDTPDADNLFLEPRSTRKGGAGIGLRHSEALARTKGGALRLAYAGPGARFELRWPIAEARSQVGAPKRAPSARLKGSRILVVEDDAAVRSLIELALEARGATAVVVANAEDFDRVVSRALFDAALVDLSPIKERVAASLNALRRTSPEVVTVLISGAASGPPNGLEHHFDAWVRKPFEMGEIIDTLGAKLALRAGV